MDIIKENQIVSLPFEMQKQNDNRFEKLTQEMGDVKQEVGDLRQELSNVSGQLEENTRILRALEQRIEENSAKIEGLTMEMVKAFGESRAENSKRFKYGNGREGRITANVRI